MKVELISTLDEYSHCSQAGAIQQNAFHLYKANVSSQHNIASYIISTRSNSQKLRQETAKNDVIM